MHRFTQTLFGSRRRTIVSIGATIALIFVSIAAAQWFLTAEGTTQIKSGKLVSPTIEAPASIPETLLPGVKTAMVVKTTNPNTFGLIVTGVDLGVGNPTSSDEVACPGNNLQVIGTTTLSIPLPTGTSDVSLPDTLMLRDTAPTGCQGITFTVPVKLSLRTP